MSQTGVVLLDRYTLVRGCVRHVLEQQADIEVRAEAGSVGEAEALDVEADVVVADLDLPDVSGAAVPAVLRKIGLASRILVVSAVDHPGTVQEAVAAGADGYLLKSASMAELLLAVRTVARGEAYLQPSLGVALAQGHEGTNGNGTLSGARPLTPKEEDVLRLVALGHTNVEVGRLLAISVRTVETHRASILRKIGRQTRAELVRYAFDCGLLSYANQRLFA
jgi:two-component system response regulator NreC